METSLPIITGAAPGLLRVGLPDVTQVSNSPCRRLPAGSPSGQLLRPDSRGVCGLKISDRLACARSRGPAGLAVAQRRPRGSSILGPPSAPTHRAAVCRRSEWVPRIGLRQPTRAVFPCSRRRKSAEWSAGFSGSAALPRRLQLNGGHRPYGHVQENEIRARDHERA